MSKSNVKVVFGCMTFGEEGAEQARVFTKEGAQEILDIFKSYGHVELDTARMYGFGGSEKKLAQMKAEDQGFVISTKVYPSARGKGFLSQGQYTHSAADIHRALNDSLESLETSKVDIYYLHAPDRETPFENTLAGIDEEYKAGKFARFGLSNFTADEVKQIVEICKKNNYVQPTVYQGIFNAITRSAEKDLFPVLRENGISFYAYNPLGGGFFAGGFNKESKVEEGSRFDPNRSQGSMYRARYWKDVYFQAMDVINSTAKKNNLTTAEIAIRWSNHHSALDPKYQDAIIIGASSTRHIDQNLKDFEKGPLPQDVVDAVDKAWEIVKPEAPPYHH
ncbi:AKR7 [Phaffia rhodozyma]|uniref:AKR7 n=1 Tax=Phaffia rhodozyma TaxID=264483 RepID=A0A0F7SGW3_PHARH|nr:AKR7 [Phaffia rhodozyma]